MSNAGPPPVQRANNEQRASTALVNYQTITETLKSNRGAEAKAIRAMFGDNKQLADRFLSVCFSILASESRLLEDATPMSIVEAIKKAASLGLEPMTDDAAINVYSGKAQLIPMYKGYLKRIRRSGTVSAVDAVMVYANDEFDYGTSEMGHWFRHHPAKARKVVDDDGVVTIEDVRGDYAGAYAFARMNDGFVYFRFMDVDEINYVRDTWGNKVSKSGRPLPWTTSYDQMALKTVIRRLAKVLPQEAVGQEFLDLERAADEAEQTARDAASTVGDRMIAEVRQLALNAVNPGLPDVSGPAETPEAGAGSSPESAGQGDPSEEEVARATGQPQ